MALTVVKYRKTQAGDTTAAVPAILVKSKMQQPSLQQQQIAKKPIIKLEHNANIVINKIPSGIKPTMKRSTITAVEPAFKTAKYSLQTINSAGTPITAFDGKLYSIQQSGTTITAATSASNKKQQQITAAIGSLPPSTIIQATSATELNKVNANVSAVPYIQTNGTNFNTLSAQTGTALQVRRPTIYIKRDTTKRTIRTVTLELIEKNPYVHLGVASNRLLILKNIVCVTANVSLIDLYITLKKLRQNEDFALLAEYFELSETEVQHIFMRSVVKLAGYLRFLVCWPDSKKYYDRHKNLPFAFRSKLSHVQSLIECVETDMQRPVMQFDCNNYKFILTISTNGIITYVSDAYVGHHDDLTIFNASNFRSVIPKYLSLVADPGKAVRRKLRPKRDNYNTTRRANLETDSNTDSADEFPDEESTVSDDDDPLLSRYAASRVAAELVSHQTLKVVNSELTSPKVKNFSIPTVRVRDSVCRLQIRHMISCLREFKILQSNAIHEPLLYQYLNEILIVSAALTNLQR